jgi:pimeloyl-ACP methyl ester carboxylesterase
MPTMHVSNSIAPVAPDAAKRLALDGGAALVVRGEPGAAPLLFLHGVAGAAWSWAPQASAFADSRRTYAWEARGHGDAARVDDAGLAEYYDDARQALSHVTESEGKGAIVVAHSLGGLLALALAAERPAEVAALFLVEPVYLASACSPLGALGPLTLFGPLALPFILALAEHFKYDTPFGRTHARFIFESSFHDRSAMERAWEHQRRQKPVEYRRLLVELSGASTRFPLRQFAREIAAPVALIEGTNLVFGMHFPHLVRQLQALGSGFTHRVISGGHYLQLDREPAVTAELRDFIGAVAAAR